MATAETDVSVLISGAQHFVTCEDCDARPAVYHCQTCPGDLCDECEKKHKQKKLFRKHNITSLAQSRTVCSAEVSEEPNTEMRNVMKKIILSVTISTSVKEQYSLARLGSSNMLIAAGDRSIFELEVSGKMKQTIATNLPEGNRPTGITVLNDNSVLYIDSENKRIVRYTSDMSKRKYSLFSKTKWWPYCVCATRSGDVLVGEVISDEKGAFRRMFSTNKYDCKGKIEVFTVSGQKKFEIEKDNGEQIYQHPFYLAENNVNQDIVVSDNGEEVVVVTKAGRRRFIYHGNDPKLDFSPRQIDTDCLGNIIICDFFNKIHLISKDGYFISYLVVGEDGIDSPSGICFDEKDSVWIAEFNSQKVKVFKYLE